MAFRQQPVQNVLGHDAVSIPPPPVPAPPSPFEWGRTERISELLGESFDLKFEKGVSYYREQNGEAAWNAFVNGYGPTKSLNANLSDEKRAELKRDFMMGSPRPSAFACHGNIG